MPSVAREGFDLLRLPGARELVLWRGFPYIFQAAMLVAFVAMAVLSWNAYTPPGVNAKTFAKTNLVTLLVWGIWWPATVWVAVWLGRAWCLVCPLELVSNATECFARRNVGGAALVGGGVPELHRQGLHRGAQSNPAGWPQLPKPVECHEAR